MIARRAAFVLVLWAARAIAAPVVEVRGRMRIELDHVERGARGMTINGRLLDEDDDEPMGNATIALRVGALGEDGAESFRYGSALPVEVDGAFRFAVPVGDRARYLLHLTAPATGLHDAASPVELELDFAVRPIELRLFVPAERSADSATLPIGVEAVALDRGESTNGAATAAEDDLPVDIELDGVPTATLVLKAGRASALVPLVAHAGQEVTVRARFAGDGTRGPAEATARVRLVEKATMTLAAEPARVALGGDVTLRGTLRFGERAVGGLPVVVRLASEEARAEVAATTDPSGAFEVKLRAPSDGTNASYECVFRDGDAKARGLPAARSPVVVVELLPGFSLTDLGARPAGAALGIAAALLLLLGLLRAGASIAARKAPVQQEPVAAPRPRATLRTATDRSVAGYVIDGERRKPIVGARVELRTVALSRAVLTDERGGFAFAASEQEGDSRLLIAHDGFVSLTLRGRIPHQGEWAALDVRLLPLRAELLRRYGAALAASVPSGETLGLRTPRELALLALRHRPTLDRRALGVLRAWIEVSCFGPVAPLPDALGHLETLVDDLTAHSSLPSPPSRP